MLQLIAQFGEGITDNSGYFSQSSSEGTNAFTNIETLISNMLGLATVLGGLFFVFFFVIGAFNWITAGGDTAKIGKARDQMIQGVIGLVVLVASYAILGLIGTVVGLNLLSPGQELLNLTPETANQSQYELCLSNGNTHTECAGILNN